MLSPLTVALQISAMKSCFWGSDYPALIRLSGKWSLPIRDHLEALGVEWMLHHAITLIYQKIE